MTYYYGVLRTDVSPQAASHNDQLLGNWTLGLEVTDKVLAERCGLGNIDPQHTVGGQGISSAIEAALSCALPPDGASLVTIRPDKDSFGAMAVLTLRAEGNEKKIDLHLVSWLGAMDSMGFENARRELPELHEAVGDSREITTAIQVITRSPQLDWTIERRIEAISSILTGEMPQEKITRLATLRPRPSSGDYEVEMFGSRVAFITAPGDYHKARDWGNRRYPVAVVFDPEYRDETQSRDSSEPYPRWTLVRQMGCFDRKGFEEAINRAEAESRKVSLINLTEMGNRWGGPPNIVTSPKGQGHETTLSADAILAIVQEHAESGVVT